MMKTSKQRHSQQQTPRVQFVGSCGSTPVLSSSARFMRYLSEFGIQSGDVDFFALGEKYAELGAGNVISSPLLGKLAPYNFLMLFTYFTTFGLQFLSSYKFFP
jgi:hypothetical protein